MENYPNIKNNMTVQTAFFQHFICEEVSITLSNNQTLEGKIMACDQFTILFESNDQVTEDKDTHLIFKSSIVNIKRIGSEMRSLLIKMAKLNEPKGKNKNASGKPTGTSIMSKKKRTVDPEKLERAKKQMLLEGEK